ncbi:MAG: hypothetical protein IJA72_00400 [Clostridia bacterium]|nr:hypothetical protein [Clostridia bacterium]
MQYKYSKALFGTALEIKEETRKPRFIAKRVGEIAAANKNKSKQAKRVSKNSKALNHNSTKHL